MSKKWRNDAMPRNFENVDKLFPQLSEIEKYFNEPEGYFFKNGFFVQALHIHLWLLLA
jgi:hypothetical protein